MVTIYQRDKFLANFDSSEKKKHGPLFYFISIN